MESDYKEIFSLFGYCFCENYDLYSNPKYKHCFYWIGKERDGLIPDLIFNFVDIEERIIKFYKKFNLFK